MKAYDFIQYSTGLRTTIMASSMQEALDAVHNIPTDDTATNGQWALTGVRCVIETRPYSPKRERYIERSTHKAWPSRPKNIRKPAKATKK